MRRIVLFIALSMFCLLGAQVTTNLELTNIGTTSVSGVLTIWNNTPSPVTWHFSHDGDFEIMVDGTGSSVLYLPLGHTITIEPSESYVKDIYHCRLSPYNPGIHTAQVGIFQGGLQPMGDIQTFNVPPYTDDITALNYTFSITAIASNRVTGIVWAQNPGSEAWHGSFPYGAFAEIWVDGIPNDIYHIPGITHYEIQPGVYFWQVIYHNQNASYANGLHYATVHLQIPGFPQVAEELSFHIGPMDMDDDIAQAEIALKACPNPFRDHLNISSKGQKNLEIYNLKGQLIRSWRKQDSAIWDGRDTAGKACPAGIYILKGDSQSRKIIKLN